MATTAYTVKIKFTGNEKLDVESGSILWEMGNHSLSISYPYLNYTANGNKWFIHLGGVGVKNYDHYKKGNKVEITTIYDSVLGKKTIYVDGYLLAEKVGTLPTLSEDLTIKTRTGASYYKFLGEIDSISVENIANYIVPLKALTEELRRDDYPIGYIRNSQDWSTVKSALEQLKAFKKPILNNSPRTASCVDFNYVGGNVKESIDIQAYLYDNFNWELRIINNISVFYKEYIEGATNTLTKKLIEYAKTLVNPFVSVTSSWAHLQEINGLKCADITKITSESALSKFDGDRAIYETIATAINDEIGTMEVARHRENDEYVTGYAQKWGYVKTAEIVNYVLSKFRTILGNPPSSEYDVHSPWFYSKSVFPFKERMAINTDDRGTIQFYPRYAWNWREWSGADRGILFYLNSKIEEIKNGNELNVPYICFGWDKITENNMTPAQALGLANVLQVAGVDYFNSAYFTINESGKQNDKSFIWQLVIPAYAQESVDEYRHIITEGKLCKGDVLYNYYYTGEPVHQYNFKTGDKSILCVARKLNDEYLIAATYQPLSNFKGQAMAKDFEINLEGTIIKMKARRQGSVYYYNKATGKLKLTNPQHQAHHFERWD